MCKWKFNKDTNKFENDKGICCYKCLCKNKKDYCDHCCLHEHEGVNKNYIKCSDCEHDY